MLEEPGIRLLSDSDRAWRLVSLDGEQLLGSARWSPNVENRWTFWRRPFLEIREPIDEPLVCTIHRRWSWQTEYEVYDAEGGYVGSIASGRLALRGIRRAEQQAIPEGTLFRDEAGEMLGRWEGNRLVFTPFVQDDPFFKMLLLAWVLVRVGNLL